LLSEQQKQEKKRIGGQTHDPPYYQESGEQMRTPFKRFTVHTDSVGNANLFHVQVSDIAGILANLNPKGSMPSDVEIYRLSLTRALFIQEAIEEKMERERGQQP